MSVRDTDVGGISLVVDADQWYEFAKHARSVDKQIVIRLRRRMKGAGMVAVEEIKKTLGLPSPDGGPDDGAMRDLLAAAAKTTVSFTKRSAGVKVSVSNRTLPVEHKGLMKVYNKETFRHPVFEKKAQFDNRKSNSPTHRTFKSSRAGWVEQKGRPYMGKAFQQQVRELAIKEVNAALEEALRELRR
jgi:hypothetical protein